MIVVSCNSKIFLILQNNDTIFCEGECEHSAFGQNFASGKASGHNMASGPANGQNFASGAASGQNMASCPAFGHNFASGVASGQNLGLWPNHGLWLQLGLRPLQLWLICLRSSSTHSLCWLHWPLHQLHWPWRTY